MLRELLGGEDEALLGRTIFRRGLVDVGVVIAIDNQLSFDGNRFALLVVEVQATTKAARRLHACGVADSVGPDGDHSGGLAVFASLVLFFLLPILTPRKGRWMVIEVERLATGAAKHHNAKHQ